MKKGPGVALGYALKQLFSKPATIKYPHVPIDIDRNYRGKLVFDPTNCIGCNLCMRDCPTGAITINNVGTKEDKKFECYLDFGHCIFCAQCVESCRKGCLAMTPNVELAVLDKKDTIEKL